MLCNVTPTHTLLSDVYLKDRTLRNNSTSPGEILSSHRWSVSREMETSLKSHFLLGCIHDFATNEQLRSDWTSEARLQMTSCINSGGRLIPTLHSWSQTWKMLPRGDVRTHLEWRRSSSLTLAGDSRSSAPLPMPNRSSAFCKPAPKVPRPVTCPSNLTCS